MLATLKSLLHLKMISIFGYAAVFNNIDSDRDVILKGALCNINDQFNLYWQHNLKWQIGKIESIKEDNKGHFIKASIWQNLAHSKQINKAIRNHEITGLSIGFKPLETKMISSKKIRLITRLHLYEISLVTKPANHQSQIEKISF